MTAAFLPDQISSFRFVAWQFDNTSFTLTLEYAFDDAYRFVEQVSFPKPSQPLSSSQTESLNRCFDLLHLAAGISYFKAAVPPAINIENQTLSEKTAGFLELLYRNGLGEFAFQNKLKLHEKIKFPFSPSIQDSATQLATKNKTLVPVGGGKDSIVSIETLKSSNINIDLFSVGSARPIIDTVARAERPHLIVTRKLSPELFELNQQGAYNGHVPITAIVSLLALATAIIHGHDAIAFSNERSANIGNITLDDGFEVNHQFSKSFMFEKELSAQIRRSITPSISYFSLLRPYSELQIAGAFAKSDQYDDVFTSCNSNFSITGKRSSQRWCCDCPKCRFVFLMLAPFMEKERLLGIFGNNLLNNPNQQSGYDELFGIDAHKPFECVGEYEESLAALSLLAQQESWKDDALVAHYRRTLLPTASAIDSLVHHYLSPAQEHQIPIEQLSAVEDYFQDEI
ncbi:MAG: hypothetical protein ACWA44_01635 [Thiotrichales bacterium]